MAADAPRVYSCECRVILGVDRLDYTKGLVSRLKSFQSFLVKYPKWIGKVLLLQVCGLLVGFHFENYESTEFLRWQFHHARMYENIKN